MRVYENEHTHRTIKTEEKVKMFKYLQMKSSFCLSVSVELLIFFDILLYLTAYAPRLSDISFCDWMKNQYSRGFQWHRALCQFNDCCERW